MQELKSEFEKNGGTFREYRIGDLFEKIATKNVIKNSIGDLPATTAVLSNNQIGRYISRENATILKNVFSATANGFGKAFYQPNEFTVLQDSYAFKFKDESIRIDKIHSYIVAVLNKIYAKYDWNNKSGWAKIKDEIISLPTTSEGTLAFDYMEAYIRELEEERVCELAAYLKVSGLEDYTLTAEEEAAIERFRAGGVETKEVKFCEIFNKIVQGRRLKKDDQLPGNIPFVMAGVTNTGIVKYISNPVAMFPKNSITIDIFGNTFYRDYSFGAGDDTGVYWSEEIKYSKEQMLFLATLMKCSLKGRFSYGAKLRSSQSFNFEIFLPITPSGEIDYAFMELYISGMQKMAIRNVVLWKDKVMGATQACVGASASAVPFPA